MRGQRQPHDVVLHVRGEDHLADELLPLARSRAPSITLSGFDVDAARGAVEDRRQFLAAGIADDQLEEEAVELGFGQRIGAFLLDRVLRGHHEERLLRA